MKTRPLKFRAWDKHQSKMLYKGFSLNATSPTWSPNMDHGSNDQELQSLINSHYHEKGDIMGGDYTLNDWSDWYGINNLIVMQWTGLEDKNNNPIFEGDIVNGGSYNGSYCYGKIVFNEGSYYAEPIGKFKEGISEDWKHFEVIGNIYENPRIIKIRNNE